MRTIIIEKEIYSYDELPEDIQQEIAINNVIRHGYDCLEDYKDSLHDFENLVGIKVDWEIGTYGGANYSWERKWNCDYAEEITDGKRFARWIYNHIIPTLQKRKLFYKGKMDADGKWTSVSRRSRCIKNPYLELNGIWTESGLLQPIEECISYKADYTFESLMDECLDRFFDRWLEDMEYEETTEYFSELANANDYEFYADGSFAQGKDFKMMYPRELFSINEDVTKRNIAEYDHKREMWYKGAEKLFPEYFEMTLRERMRVRETINTYVGYSL